MYFGCFTTNDLSSLTSTLKFENDAKKKVSLISWYVDWGLNQDFQFTYMDNVRNHGSTPIVTFEPWNPYDGVNQPSFSLSNIIAGNFDTYITKFAQDAKSWGHPFFLRFAHEMNGTGWYPWQERYNNNISGQYIQAWKHVFDIFTNVGATNVMKVWCPNTIYVSSTPLVELYPGDTYVDYVGMDNYNWGNLQPWSSWESFTLLFKPTYDQLVTMTTKPIIIGEMASTESGGSKAQWITNMLTKELHNFPQIKAFIWFNVKKETDWRIESSSTSQGAFAKGIASPFYQSTPPSQ